MSSHSLTSQIATAGGYAGSGATAAPSVRTAIARAAEATGVDFSYLLAQARLESSLDPNARAATSSASGLYQFTDATWAQTLAKHGDALATMTGGSGSSAVLAALSDPTQRASLMALRNDPQASALMAAELAGDNNQALTTALGRAPDASELYLAHFLGSDGAAKFLSALAADPTQSAAALLPKAAASNRAIFYDAAGSARSLGTVMALVKSRMDAAMQDGTSPGPVAATQFTSDAALPAAPAGGPLAQAFAQAQADMSAAAGSNASMADTLATTFGLGTEGASAPAPDFVRTAYGQMQQLGF